MRQLISITLAAIIIAVLPISLTANSDQNQNNRTLLMSIGESDYNVDDIQTTEIKSRKNADLKDGITSQTGEFIIRYDKPTGFSIYPDWELESTSVNLLSGLFNFRPSLESESYIIKQQPAGAFISEYSSRSKERFIEGIRFIQVNVFRDY